MAFYSDIESIKGVFLQKDIADWELYNGKVKNKPTGNKALYILAQSSSGASIEDSLSELEESLNRVSYKGGNAMLFLGPHDDAPLFAVPIFLSKNTMTRPPTAQTSAGVTGYRGMESTLEDKMKIYDLSRRLEDMENASTGSFAERIGERVIDQIDPNLLIGAITAVLSKITGASMPEMPEVTAEHTSDAEIGEGKLLTESLSELMTVLGENFKSEQEATEFVKKVTQTIKTNPALLKSLG